MIMVIKYQVKKTYEMMMLMIMIILLLAMIILMLLLMMIVLMGRGYHKTWISSPLVDEESTLWLFVT